MAKFDDKISNLIFQQAPDFVLDDHPQFLEFVKAYYQFMESAELTLTNIGDPDVIQLETQTGTASLLLLDGTNGQKDDNGDNLLLEDTSFGDFQNLETITGQTSGATATVLVEDVDNNSKLYISAQNKFIEGEKIIGATSGAEANIGTYRGNPVQNIQELLDYPDPDHTIQGFLTKFRNAFLQSIPDTLDSGVDKRKLIKNIKSLYRAKGTKRATEVFFKLLFNENAEITLPKEQMLRISDGKFDSKRLLRCIEQVGSDATKLVGQTITQLDVPGNASINEASAIVENVFKFSIGGTTVTEIILGEDTIEGTFVAGQTIQGISNDDEDLLVKCTLEGIIATKTINNDGNLMSEGDLVTVTGGTTSTTGTIRRFDQATATATADVVTTTDGAYINQDGHISETTMKIQDSLLYQDYSYIIKVGRSINDWRDTYSSTLHTSGFYFQGEVAIRTRLDARLKNITGLNTGVVEVIQGVIKTIFTTLFGRRLGTTSDGTTLRANPLVGVDPDFTDSTTPPQLSSTTRDVTINAAYKLKFRSGGSVSVGGVECKRGFLYSGYSYRTVNREPFRTFRDGIEIALESGIGSGHLLLDGTGHTANATNVDDENSRVLYEDNDIKGLTIAELNKLKIIGTGTSLDGDTALLTMLQNEQTRSFKTSLAIPSHITAVKS